MKRTKNRLWLRLAIPLMLAMFLTACGGSGGDGPNIPNYKVLEAVPANGTKTLQAGTADTHEVETDGTWIVWKGRTINMGYYNGSSVKDLNLGIPLSTTPWAFGDCDDSPIAYDGTTLVFVANDVADAAPSKFFYLKPGQAAKSIEIEFEFDYYYDGVHVHGSYAAVYDYSESVIYVAKLTDANPQFEMVELVGTLADAEPVGLYLPVNNSGQLELIDISDPTNVITLSDGASFSYIRSANKTMAWVSNGNVYYWKEGMDDSALVHEGGIPSYPLPGPNYMLWMAGGNMYYLPQSGYGAEASPTQLAFSGDYTYDLEAGNGFFAYIDDDAEYNYQIYVYDLSDPSATAGIPVTQNGEGAYESDANELIVDGDKVYSVFEYCDINNPSKVLLMYNFANGTLMDLTGDRDFQQVSVVQASNGKAVFLHRDHSFRLFAKRAATKSAFTTLTPINMMVEKFSINNSVVTFLAVDRLRYLDDDPTLMDTYDTEDLKEVYYIRMSAPGTIHQVTDNFAEEHNPQTDGKFITWYDYGYDEDLAENRQKAWAYEISSTTMTELADVLYGSSYLHKVSVDNGIAVWRQQDYVNSSWTYGVYYYDLNTGSASEDPIFSANSIWNCPNIADGLIAWRDHYSRSIYYYDLNAQTPTVQSLNRGTYDVYRPVTDGRYITWEEYRSNWDHDNDAGTPSISINVIMLYDTSAEELITVTPANVSGIDETCQPRISDGLVVFASNGYGDENLDQDREIYYYDLNAVTPEVVRLTNDPEGEGLWDSKPQVSGRLIVWRTGGSRNWDWDGKTPAAARIP